METQKINPKWGIMFVIAIFLFLTLLLVLITWCLPVCSEKLDKHFNPTQEIVEERFTYEYSGILNVYHDNKLNVTCWETGYSNTGVGLSCIPDVEIEGSLSRLDNTT